VSAETPLKAGPEVEFFMPTAAVNGHSSVATGKQHTDLVDVAKGHLTDQQQQQCTTGDYEVLVGGGQPLMW